MSAVDDTAFETVEINGEVFKVPQQVVKEIELMRESKVELIRDFHHNEEDTIIITFPDGLGPEGVERLGEMAQITFGEAKIALVPESMGFHTQEKLAELLSVGADMAAALEDRSDIMAAYKAVKAWKELTE